MYYVLDGQRTVPVHDGVTWAVWFEEAYRTGTRVVKCEFVAENVQVSTVFIGIGHQFGEGKPLLFETMVFGGPMDSYQERYATWGGAEYGHEKIVEKVKEALTAKQ